VESVRKMSGRGTGFLGLTHTVDTGADTITFGAPEQP
jgi:hypothetical protein